MGLTSFTWHLYSFPTRALGLYLNSAQASVKTFVTEESKEHKEVSSGKAFLKFSVELSVFMLKFQLFVYHCTKSEMLDAVLKWH